MNQTRPGPIRPILLVEDRDVEEAYKLGCNSYIVKPVEFNKFMDLVSNVEVYWCALNLPPRS